MTCFSPFGADSLATSLGDLLVLRFDRFAAVRMGDSQVLSFALINYNMEFRCPFAGSAYCLYQLGDLLVLRVAGFLPIPY